MKRLMTLAISTVMVTFALAAGTAAADPPSKPAGGGLNAAAEFIKEKGTCPGRMEIRSGGFHWDPVSVKCID